LEIKPSWIGWPSDTEVDWDYDEILPVFSKISKAILLEFFSKGIPSFNGQRRPDLIKKEAVP